MAGATRGLPQITGHDNYAKFGIADAPEKAAEMATAIRILFDGMIGGLFTGKKLADYFNQVANDPVGARAIISTKASLIAGYYRSFLDALEAARSPVRVTDVTPEAAKAEDVPASQSGTALTTVGGCSAARVLR